MAKTDKTPTDLLVRRYNGKLKRLLEAVDELTDLFPTKACYDNIAWAEARDYFKGLREARAAFGKEETQ